MSKHFNQYDPSGYSDEDAELDDDYGYEDLVDEDLDEYEDFLEDEYDERDEEDF